MVRLRVSLRVLIVSPGMHPRDGGPPRVVAGSAVAIAKQGIKVEVLTTGSPADDAAIRAAWPEFVELGIELHIFPRSSPHRLGRSATLLSFVRANVERFDLLHVHCVWEMALADCAAVFRKAGKPTLVSPHGMLDQWQLAQSTLKKKVALSLLGTGSMLRGADNLLYGTREEGDEARRLSLPARIVVMPNGVTPLDLGPPEEARERFLERFPALRGWKRTVLFFSRMHRKKGLDMLVEAFGRIHREFPDAGLLAAAIAQDEAYGQAVQARIQALQPINILLTTELEGPSARAVFAASEIFSLPSHQEGFSIAIVEALSAGLPVLITDKCHMQEIERVGAGITVPATIESLEQGLRRMLSASDAEITEMGARGRELVAENYTWDKVGERLITTYNRAFGERERRNA